MDMKEKKVTCKHCGAVNQHHSFQCSKVRKPIKSGTIQWMAKKTYDAKKKAKPINKISDKQKKINAAYTALRKVFMQTNPICQFNGCTSKSTECHHTRGRGKEYMLDTTTWMALCSNHHDWCHNNDKEARELGYIKSRLSNND